MSPLAAMLISRHGTFSMNSWVDPCWWRVSKTPWEMKGVTGVSWKHSLRSNLLVLAACWSSSPLLCLVQAWNGIQRGTVSAHPGSFRAYHTRYYSLLGNSIDLYRITVCVWSKQRSFMLHRLCEYPWVRLFGYFRLLTIHRTACTTLSLIVHVRLGDFLN